MASVADSMADGDGVGAVKPTTVQSCGRDEVRVDRQAAVMLRVELGLMRRIEMLRCGLPWSGAVKLERGSVMAWMDGETEVGEPGCQ